MQKDEAYHDGANFIRVWEMHFILRRVKIYECVIYLENIECTGINLYKDLDEIKEIVKDLLELYHDDEVDLLEQQPWAKDYLA